MAFQANFLNENDFNSILDQLEDFNSINTNQENGLTTTVELIEQSNISSTSYMNLMNEIINKVKNQGYSSNGKSIQEEAREFKMTIFEINEVGDELLKFWATQKFKFPKLYQASRFYLAIPATSLIIERHFNITGMIINSKRSSLKRLYSPYVGLEEITVNFKNSLRGYPEKNNWTKPKPTIPHSPNLLTKKQVCRNQQ
ncbi:hypothetical protein BLOT_010267 [Blomia tropicalis]|nr:hypothetical protein BLOT_010267 [Blomia tropicalis]